jgi:hypothetical protein
VLSKENFLTEKMGKRMRQRRTTQELARIAMQKVS